jgi:hypothetical protein
MPGRGWKTTHEREEEKDAERITLALDTRTKEFGDDRNTRDR